jgi:membrane fusion protein (multidrug efflux system)
MQLDRTQIRSPLTGKVAKRFVSVGEQVDGTAAQPIAEVAELSEVELLGNLPAMYLAKLRVGESLAIESDAFSAKKLSGRVVAISPAVDAATNVGLIRIRIPNSNGVVRLGMYLTAQIAVENHPNALTLPPEAVYRDEKGDPHVYRVEQNKATAADVKLGIQTKDRVEILSGVNEGDTVILSGGYGLTDQADVQIKP